MFAARRSWPRQASVELLRRLAKIFVPRDPCSAKWCLCATLAQRPFALQRQARFPMFLSRSVCCDQCRVLSVVDYDAVRTASTSVFATKLSDVRAMIAKMQKAQRLAEKSLDSCDIRIFVLHM